jgi:hypothetical protein
MTLSEQGECLWNHCSNGSNSKDFIEFVLTQSVLANPSKITKLETEEILDWLAKDIQTKTLIDRKISIIITSKWSESQSAHQQWDILSQSQVCVQPE